MAFIGYGVDAAVWDHLGDAYKNQLQKEMSAACLAIVENWPGMKCEYLSTWVMEGADLPHVEENPALILPLTEKTDDKA